MTGNLKDLLLSYDCPDDWAQYIPLLQYLDSKLHQRHAETKKEATNTLSRATLSALSTTSAPTPHIASNPAYLGPPPMELSAAQKQAEQERIYAGTPERGHLHLMRHGRPLLCGLPALHAPSVSSSSSHSHANAASHRGGPNV